MERAGVIMIMRRLRVLPEISTASFRRLPHRLQLPATRSSVQEAEASGSSWAVVRVTQSIFHQAGIKHITAMPKVKLIAKKTEFDACLKLEKC